MVDRRTHTSNPVGGRRFRASDNPNKYLAFYDLTAPDVLDHPDYEKYRTSPCTERIAKYFTFDRETSSSTSRRGS